MLQLWQSTRYLHIFDHPKLGPALFLGISAIDHSCAPNAVYISHGKNLIVRTIADKIENFSDIRLCYYRDLRYGNTGCWVFKRGEEYKNEKDFYLRINIPNGNGDVKKCQNLTFKVNFLCQKSSQSFSFFFIEEYQFRRFFFVYVFWHFLITSIFK